MTGPEDVLGRERAHHDALSAGVDPAAMPPAPPDEWERALLDALGDVRGRRVLDLGCGDGSLSLELLARGAELTGLDLSPATVDLARARAERFVPGARARWVAAPAEDSGLPDGAFDLVAGKWVLHHLDDLDRGAREVRRLLAPGGRAAFVETSALNPVLAVARRTLPGRAGITRFGTEDEHPLTRADLARVAAPFASARVDFPNFWLLQLVDRNVAQRRSAAFTRWCRAADAALGRGAPRLRPYGFYLRIVCRA